MSIACLVAGFLLAACIGGASPKLQRADRGRAYGGDKWLKVSCRLPLRDLRLAARGIHAEGSPDVVMITRWPYFGSFRSASHSGTAPSLQEVPLVLYGPGFIRRAGTVKPSKPSTLADLAPTFAELLETPFPSDRPGRVLTETLVPRSERNGVPRLLLTIVWDGGGWNLLEQWPDEWPNLRALMRRGTSLRPVEVGSSPSVTPAVHTTIGTGAWPNQHGVVDIPQRVGDDVQDSFVGADPRNIRIPTLADMYDPTTQNEALVGMFAEEEWHLGMVGHGRSAPDGDKDIAVMVDGEDVYTNPNLYALPDEARGREGLERAKLEVDIQDGKADERWMGVDLSVPESLPFTPTWLVHQTSVIEEIFEREGFGDDSIGDLFYVNYKAIDHSIHKWGLFNERVKMVTAQSDRELGKLLRWLDQELGRGSWVLAVTADHGVSPPPGSVPAWPIGRSEFMQDIAASFGVGAGRLLELPRPTGLWLKPGAENLGVDPEGVANFVLRYRIEDNIVSEVDVPPEYEQMRDRRLVLAAWPQDQTERVLACARRRARS
jgi:hypothetical protein